MKHLEAEYVRLSDEELRAADAATSAEDRIAHLENALRFAQLAYAERTKPANVFDLKSKT